MTRIAIRWSGLLQIVGAALLGTAVVLISFNQVIDQLISPRISLLLLISSILLLLSLPAMYARQASAAGLPGLIGHALLQTGVLLLVVIASPPLLFPALTSASGENPIVFLLGIALTLGFLLTGVTTLRAGVFPRWIGIMLLAAMADFFFVFFVAEFLPSQAGQAGSAFFAVLLASSLAGIGLFLWRGQPD